jgi:hypothetical protein
MSSKDLIIDAIIFGLKNCSIIQNPYKQEGTYWHRFESIKSFQKINVCIDLRFYFTNMLNVESANYNIHLTITHTQMDTYDDLFSTRIEEPANLSFLYDREILSNTLDKMKRKLLELQFSIFSGVFITTTPKFEMESSFFEDIPTIKFKGEECCICHDITNTKTKCEHYLCVPCFQQIKIIQDEDDEDGEHLLRPCPLCREDIFYTTV